MKKFPISQRGFTLIELIIGISLTAILMSGMLRVLSTNLTIWTIEKKQIILQQTARIAINRVIRETRYAKGISLTTPSSLTITKLNGETNTFQLGSGSHGNTLYMIIDKTKAIPVGGISTNPITENVVTQLRFTPYPNDTNLQAIMISLEIGEQSTGEKQMINTAIYPWNYH